MEWQPIETAPKDGQNCIVGGYFADNPFQFETMLLWWDSNNELNIGDKDKQNWVYNPQWVVPFGKSIDELDVRFYPTKWLPLPPGGLTHAIY